MLEIVVARERIGRDMLEFALRRVVDIRGVRVNDQGS